MMTLAKSDIERGARRAPPCQPRWREPAAYFFWRSETDEKRESGVALAHVAKTCTHMACRDGCLGEIHQRLGSVLLRDVSPERFARIPPQKSPRSRAPRALERGASAGASPPASRASSRSSSSESDDDDELEVSSPSDARRSSWSPTDDVGEPQREAMPPPPKKRRRRSPRGASTPPPKACGNPHRAPRRGGDPDELVEADLGRPPVRFSSAASDRAGGTAAGGAMSPIEGGRGSEDTGPTMAPAGSNSVPRSYENGTTLSAPKTSWASSLSRGPGALSPKRRCWSARRSA
mmetsp:Transcript_13259/g.53166  ORF Transcript_13259/g.53166 Transcript_13259/m.53166 type:complete len:291 (-) Transcript_13259:440-1312(-)